jgi:hypothetical protein
VEGSCECLEYATVDSRKEVILKLGGWAGAKKFSPLKKILLQDLGLAGYCEQGNGMRVLRLSWRDLQ